jgi:hypothetical protein
MDAMRLRMWTYDLAREQAPTLDNLRTLAELTLAADYNALGLYLEHRFAYPSTPWAHGAGVMTPEMARTLQEEFAELQIIPFLNLLGHMEGFLYTERGRTLAEERFRGLQACPSNPDTVELANNILADALQVFSSDIIHIGGDETAQLGMCARCRGVGGKAPMRDPSASIDEVAETIKSGGQTADQKARLYARHFAPLARQVVEAGRRPAIWGDMLLEHPKAAVAMPRETLVFDWQYFNDPEKSTKRLMAHGFEVVCCPSLQTYNAAWLHVEQSERNVREHVRVARELDAYGVCVTTWENALFGSYEALLPAIQASGKLLHEQPSVLSKDEVTATPHFALFGQISYLYHGELEGQQDRPGQTSDAVNIANQILSQALTDEATTVRFEPTERGLEVRYEDAGHAGLIRDLRPQLRDALINRLRLLSGMPVEGRKLAQRGYIAGRFSGTSFRFDAITQACDFGTRVLLTRKDAAAAETRPVSSHEESILNAYGDVSGDHREWAKLMGMELQSLGGVFAYSQIRSSLKVRLLLEGNPFLAWLHHGEELSGETGKRALDICDNASRWARDPATRGVTGFIKGAVEFVRYAEQAHQAYANELPGVATATLAPARQIFEELAKIAKASHLRFGGSRADSERCVAARDHLEKVIRRIKDYGDGSLGYLPSFEHITHPNFVPHDQGAWWLINRWAYE